MAVKRLGAAACALLLLAGCAAPADPARGAGEAPSAQGAADTVKLPYTEEYTLFRGGEGGELVGLADREGTVVLPAAYREIGVSENGLLFTASDEGYRIFDPSGRQLGGTYDRLECVSTGAGGAMVRRAAPYAAAPLSPPYLAYKEDGEGGSDCWLLGEDGLPAEEAPYDDAEIFDDRIALAREGVLYERYPDGTVTKQGNEVVQTFFDGKYQVKNYCPGVHGVLFGLLDREGREIAPPEYSTVSVPFEDRYVLYRGDRTFLGGEQAFLYDDGNRLLADDSNLFSFTVLPDGRYFGLSYVGSDYTEAVILGGDGEPEPRGIYFVDKDGTRLGGRWRSVEFYPDERMDGLSLEGGAPLDGADAAAALEGGGAYFLCVADGGETRRVPLLEALRG